jgi:hypothetical protein
MKHLCILPLLFLLALSATAQTSKFIDDADYSADYTGSWVSISPTADYALGFFFKDSANVIPYIDYRAADVPDSVYQSYAPLAGDSTQYVTAYGTFKAWTLRKNGTDNIPCAALVRIRLDVLLNSGTDGATFNAYLTKHEPARGN